MAHPSKRRPENISGLFYVDSTCIDCDTCRWLAPSTFAQIGEQSAVTRQPGNDAERRLALHALTACPTASIGVTEVLPEMAEARRDFPLLIEDNVFYCGYHSEKSFGAASYLIVRPQGNVLIDSPRRAAPLWDKIEAMGGVRHLFLTHCDDVAEHEALRERFGCERIIHAADATGSLRDAEKVVRGLERVELDEDISLLPVPGHTRGSMCLLYKNRFLFTGDHLAYSESRGHLYAFHDACWFSWQEQKKSMRNLAAWRFQWVLPGHGRRLYAEGEEMRRQMEKCLQDMDLLS